MNEDIQLFAEAQLQCMNIYYTDLSLIRGKDGVFVWRVKTDDGSAVLKCFEKKEYSREIDNYKLLNSLGVPTLRMIACTQCSFLMEDIEESDYRLAAQNDINSSEIAEKVALWYKTLHEKGREYTDISSLYDECDYLTLENMDLIKAKTGTGGLHVWRVIDENFDNLVSIIKGLSRTITYNDFYYTNFVVARDNSSALIFDYNLLGKGYAYSDIRNVCASLGNDEARDAFLEAYGDYDKSEKLVDEVANPLLGLYNACRREYFPAWGEELLETLENGKLLKAVEKVL